MSVQNGKDSRTPRLALLIVAALFVAACQVPTPPARGARVDLRVEPAHPTVGTAEVVVRLIDRQGVPIRNATVNLEADMTHGGMAPVRAWARDAGGGRYTLADFPFSMEGEWVLTVQAVLPSGDRVEDAFKLTVGPNALGTGATASSPHGDQSHTSPRRAAPAEEQVAALRREIRDLAQAVQRTQVLAVVYQLDTAGFHDLDEQLAAGQIVWGAFGQVHRSRIAVQSATWPQELQEAVTALVTEMRALEDALLRGDLAGAAPHAHAVHELGHDISARVYARLDASASHVHQHGGTEEL